jgi:hypothetical protein
MAARDVTVPPNEEEFSGGALDRSAVRQVADVACDVFAPRRLEDGPAKRLSSLADFRGARPLLEDCSGVGDRTRYVGSLVAGGA